MSIQTKLFDLAEQEYAEFISKLSPNVPRERFIGVRVPLLRKLAKSIMKDEETNAFLLDLPHEYYDENIMHALLISQIRDVEACFALVEKFLPFVDNWAVCDSISPKIFVKHKPELLRKIKIWSKSSHTYTARFGLRMLMNHFLDEEFLPEYLEIPAAVRTEEYYLKMMVAWFFAEALAKQWVSTVPYIELRKLDPWIHRKAIQKARESFRITPEQKEYLKSLKE